MITLTIEGDTTIWDQLMAAYDKLATRISAALYAAGMRKKQLEAIEQEGFYDPIPTPCIERREGQGEYLRLVFPTDRAGQRRREYIGANPKKVAAAKEKLARSEERLRLRRELDAIQRDARDALTALQAANRSLEGW